ncbi:hypothetical protein SSCG_04527 [Streptomyces clavuligerus]|nr:hypothetical protein SSCG_04527 [Streptomyces clavuligerus]
MPEPWSPKQRPAVPVGAARSVGRVRPVEDGSGGPARSRTAGGIDLAAGAELSGERYVARGKLKA